jgi:hypothetical protein
MRQEIRPPPHLPDLSSRKFADPLQLMLDLSLLELDYMRRVRVLPATLGIARNTQKVFETSPQNLLSSGQDP